MTFRKQIKQWLYGKCPGFAGAFPYYGTKVYFPKNSLIFKLACQQGIYEQENLNILSSLVKPNSTYFDIGANIGLMSIPILQQDDSCNVVSFEPSPNTYNFLNRTAKSSQFNKRWVVSSKAVGSQVGTLDFFIASPDMGAFDGFHDTKRAKTNNQIEVPVTTVDIEWKTLGRPKLSVIKIDVEGAELEILKGALNCIQNEQPSILLEWNATNLKAYNCPIESLMIFARKYNYELYSLPNLVPVLNVESLLLHMSKTESFLLLSTSKYT
ncbi:MAG: FkbM family methyltransferase [Nostoc sp.]|uniref:FkbM family methyltransferase n=1 Tax=Nostoc sp. TaxID=1180 RepID=UPI002FEEA014